MCVCCKPERLMVHYVDPNLSKLTLKIVCWSNKNVPLFIKRQASKRGKRQEKEREGKKKKEERREKQATTADPMMSLSLFSSLFFWTGGGCGGAYATGFRVGRASYAIWWPLPVGRGAVARQKVSGIMCHVHAVPAVLLPLHDDHVRGWRGDPRPPSARQLTLDFSTACAHVFVMQLFRRVLQCRLLLWGLHKILTVLFQ